MITCRIGLKLLTMALCVILATGSPASAADAERHVVMITIDGLASFLIDDPKAPLPTVRRLVAEGSRVVEGMKVSNPSITWPNHTSLITGVQPEKHGVLANGVLVRGGIGSIVTVDPRRDQSDLIRVPTIIEAAHAAGLRTAEINWPCVRGSTSLGDSFPDVPEAVEHMTPRLREELIAKGLLADATHKSFASNSSAGRDLVWTEAACHVIRERKPNLLLVHLLNVDGTHHKHGAGSSEGYTANAYADACLSRIVTAVDEAGIRESTTFIVVSDHGFAMTPKAVRPNALLRQEGLLTAVEGRLTAARVHVVPEGGIGLVYCTNPGEAETLRRQVKELFTGKEGVADVLLPEEFSGVGMPHPREYDQAPDAILVAKDGYAVSSSAEGDAFVTGNEEAKTSLGSHGFLASLEKMNATCVLAGAGIRRGAKLQNVENIDIAPTIARLLAIEGFECDGQPLTEALADW